MTRGRSPAEIYRELERAFGQPLHARVETSATQNKQVPSLILPAQLAGEKFQSLRTQSPGNAAPRSV